MNLRFLLAGGLILPTVVLAQAGAQSPFFSGQLDTRLSPGPTHYQQPAQSAAPSPLPSPEPIARKLDEGIFGGTLFAGRFAQESFRGFNPNYVVGVGDWVDLRLWGALELSLRLEVDSQGNIFVPRVGPVRVLNARNAQLNALVTERIKTVYRENVGVYAALAGAEPVKVFVTGRVQAPGLYGAYAADSLLHFIDRAGGIDLETGSFLDVRVIRANRSIRAFNLYDFLLDGELPLFQLRDGDTILVGPRKNTARVGGEVRHKARFEFDAEIGLGALLDMAGLNAEATHVQIIRRQTPQQEVEYLTLAEARSPQRKVLGGDEIIVSADRHVGSIITSVEGEFSGLSQFVFSYESNLADLLMQVETTARSNMEGLQLFRVSIARRQREMLNQMLEKLEQSVLSARSGTREEAELRTREADLILRFIDRAKKIEPKGQLILHRDFDPEMISLEDRDRLVIPRKQQTVAVQGEVYFPSAFVHQPGKGLKFYLEQAGGLSQNGSQDHVFVRRPNGELVAMQDGWFSGVRIQPGDEILVLPKVDAKKFQFSKDLVQIIYQIALSAGVILRI